MARDGGELGRLEHGPGRVRRARDHKAVNRRLDRFEQLDRERERGVRAEAEAHDLDAERAEDVLVGGEGRLRHHDPVARVEGGEEAQHEGARRADGDDHPPGIDAEVVAGAVVLGDRRAQRRPPERFGVAERDRAQRPAGRLEDRCRWTPAGLADLQMDHVVAPRGAGVRRGQHVHGDERRDLGPFGNLERRSGGNGRHAYSGLRLLAPPFCHSRRAYASDGRPTGGPGPAAQHSNVVVAPCE